MKIVNIKTLTDEEIEEWSDKDIRELFRKLQKITVKVIKTANDVTEVAGIRGKMIEMMAEQLAGCCILDDESSNNDVTILASKQEALDYYFEKAYNEICGKGEKND